MTIKRRILFCSVTLAIGAVLAEGSLQLLCALSPQVRYTLLPPWRQILPEERELVQTPQVVPGNQLGWRGNPEYCQHDNRGFHNTRALDRASIVTIGDSHTYGSMVDRDQAWPAVLGRLAARPTYNMGFGGWGPVEYGLVVDEALALEPDVVVFGMYFGNDLFDAFRAVYGRGVETQHARPELFDRLAQLEAEAPLKQQTLRLFGYGHEVADQAAADKAETGRSAGVRTLLSEHCKLYAVARLLACSSRPAQATALTPADASWSYAVRWAENHKQDCSILELQDSRTVLTAPYRHVALNLDDPRIDEGLHISLSALRAAANACHKNGARPIVVLLPTKELVFSRSVPRIEDHPGLAELISQERAARDIVQKHLAQHGIECIDALPALQADLESCDSTQPYPAGVDGHPNASGNEAIARTVAAYLLQCPKGGESDMPAGETERADG